MKNTCYMYHFCIKLLLQPSWSLGKVKCHPGKWNSVAFVRFDEWPKILMLNPALPRSIHYHCSLFCIFVRKKSYKIAPSPTSAVYHSETFVFHGTIASVFHVMLQLYWSESESETLLVTSFQNGLQPNLQAKSLLLQCKHTTGESRYPFQATLLQCNCSIKGCPIIHDDQILLPGKPYFVLSVTRVVVSVYQMKGRVKYPDTLTPYNSGYLL